MTSPPAPRPRCRDLGVTIGFLPTGAGNTITDVPGVLAGHVTVWRDEADPPVGRGVARTGVTAIVPHGLAEVFRTPLPAGVAVLNGAGELTGSVELREWGLLETPIVLTATMQVGRGYDGVVEALCDADPACGTERVVIPVVGECDDSWLNDARRIQVTTADVRRALAAASAAPLPLGAVGAGTGMVTCGHKGGIGSASRVLQRGHVVGVLALSNWGEASRLVIDGVPVGRRLADRAAGAPVAPAGPPVPAGSCLVVVATDAPLGPRTLERVAARCGLGLARCGSTAHHGSGEIFVAFSTVATPDPSLDHDSGFLDECFGAVVEATEEAVVDALFVADTVAGRAGRTVPGLPVDEVLAGLAAAGRLGGGTGRSVSQG